MQAHSHARALAYRAAIAYEKQRRVLGRVSTVLCAYHPSTTTNLDSSRRPSVGVRCTFFVPNLPHTHTHTQWTEGHTRIITRPPPHTSFDKRMNVEVSSPPCSMVREDLPGTSFVQRSKLASRALVAETRRYRRTW